MDLTLLHEGTFRLENFRTTNKIEEDDEVLTGYLTMTGLVPADLFATLTGVQVGSAYTRFFWGKDEAVAYPGIGPIPFDVEAVRHIVELKSGIRYEDNDATIRKFKLEPIFGTQWTATFEVLIHPRTDAVVGRIAAKQGHDIIIAMKGPREGDMFAENGDGDADA